jgi:hypothetical protein
MARQPVSNRREAHDDVLLGEVARTLGISRTTAWTRVLRGLIPAEFRGGRYIVSRKKLAELRGARDSGVPDTQQQPRDGSQRERRQ